MTTRDPHTARRQHPAAGTPGWSDDGVSRTVRELWDRKSWSYDRSSTHNPSAAIEVAAWNAALHRLLPPPPAKVLDVGAGTGFLSLLLAGQGHRVTAVDLSEHMLARLEQKAAQAGLSIRTVVGDAAAPPGAGFDAVVERHVIWTLPRPLEALEAWHAAAPGGRLVLFSAQWGRANGILQPARGRARALLRSLRREGPADDTRYGSALRAQLPFSHGTAPEDLIDLVDGAGWGAPRVERLLDLDWAARRAAPTLLDRLVGAPPRFAVVAGS